jgi:hypothetical protein
MVFDALESCQMEEVFRLPVCSQSAPDTVRLHAALQTVVAWMADHHVPRDNWDAPYVYRLDYLPDWISANDVAALGRITVAASLRNVPLPEVLVPLLPAQLGEQVTANDVTYTAAHAGEIADVLGPLASAMDATTNGHEGRRPRSWWLLASAAAGVLVGCAIVGGRRREAREPR